MNIIINEEVKLALKKKTPIVALESTIITHGMPYPDNIKCAKQVEDTIRKEGVTPATVAFIKGECHVGLTDDDFSILGLSTSNIKVSRRDIPVVVAKKLSGGTTVAATMIIAEMCGIKVFVTGGIGGVHKEGNINFDISADLDELSKTDVAVVCAGPKAILDIPLTLEYLETKGVAVLGYKTEKLPLFYTYTSEFDVDYMVDSCEEIAKIMEEKWSSNIKGGLLITVPLPREHSIDPKYINDIISKAEKEAKKNKIKGKKLTPFLLSKISQLTNKNSLKSNIALIINNAKIGANIAKEYYK